MARTRACSKPAGKTKKDLKQQLKAEKQIKKNEKCLEKALSAYQKQGHQTDFDFIIAQLEQTPKWVAPLAQLIRHGAMGVLLKTGSMEAEKTEVRHLGEKWQGKAKRILQLPLEVLVSMLEKAKLKLSEDDATDEATVLKCCRAQFWITDQTPLPQHQNIKFVSTLLQFAEERHKELGFSHFSEKSDLTQPMWTIDDEHNLVWNCAEGAEVTSITLPQLPEGEWSLSDENSPDCMVLSESHKKFTFDCRGFFPDVEEVNPSLRWKIQLAPSSSELESAGSKGSGLAFEVSPKKAWHRMPVGWDRVVGCGLVTTTSRHVGLESFTLRGKGI